MNQPHDTLLSRTAGSLADIDPAVNEALGNEARRQRTQIELIASENVMSRAVCEALGHEIGNKTLEGYAGNRFHGGGENVDVVERLAIERAKELFGAIYANVQPHSGTQANQTVFFALLRPGDRILSLNLAAGGHLSHGASANLSGRWFDSHHYGVDRETGLLDYDAIEARAREVQPTLLIAGGSAYPRTIDFERMGHIAKRVGAKLLVDMAAHRGAGRRGRACITAATRGHRDRHDDEDASRTARRIHPVAVRRARETPSVGGVPRSPGQPAFERPRRQGGVPGRSASPGVRRVRATRGRQCPHARQSD